MHRAPRFRCSQWVNGGLQPGAGEQHRSYARDRVTSSSRSSLFLHRLEHDFMHVESGLGSLGQRFE